jgi:glycosyltransferase involved in cell wall biosynthesis
MARELIKMGVAVTLVTLGRSACKPPPHVRVVSAPWDPGENGSIAALAASIQWISLLLMQIGRLDVLQAQSVHPMGMAVALAGRVMGVPTVARISSSGPYGEIRQLLRRPAAKLRLLLMSWVHRYVALSPAGLKDLPEPLQMRGLVIPNGVDLDRFRPPSDIEKRQARQRLGLDESSLVYCYIGRLMHFKAVHELVHAWQEAPLDESCLLVVGDGPEASRLNKQSSGRSGGDRVKFVGPLCDVVPALWAADVVVQPSRVEGFSNSVLEAMACGLPVIARRLSCYSYFLDVVATFDDLPGLSALIRRSADPAWRREHGERNREAVAALGAARIAERYAELYRSLTT